MLGVRGFQGWGGVGVEGTTGLKAGGWTAPHAQQLEYSTRGDKFLITKCAT